jgi:thiamine transport system ATP-binding protein
MTPADDRRPVPLDVDGVTVRFGSTAVLDGVMLHVDAGEIVALLGASGSGKSTLLRAVAGLVPIDAGEVRVDGVDVTGRPTHRRDVGMVFQDNQLFPHLSTGDNVSFGARMTGAAAGERRRLAAEWLRRVGLDGFAERSVTELSGGEAKRVALARTLATSPAVVLLDEPLTGLDRDLRDRLADDVAALLRGSATTAVLVTHDRDEAGRVADRSVEIGSLHRRG